MAKKEKLYKSKTSNPLLFVFLTGVILILLACAIKFNHLRSLSYAGNLPVVSTQERKSTPERITIKSANIDLPVGETFIVKNNWQILDNGASHLTTSANPGENGNDIIYAHNTLDRFGTLTQVKKGNVIIVSTKDGKAYAYKVISVQTVDPSNTKPLALTTDEVLTLYTCTGFADLKRLIIQAGESYCL